MFVFILINKLLLFVLLNKQIKYMNKTLKIKSKDVKVYKNVLNINLYCRASLRCIQ